MNLQKAIINGQELCMLCRGTGIKFNGEVCDCGVEIESEESEKVSSVLFIPRDRIGNNFSKDLVPGTSEDYANYLDSIHRTITKKGRIDRSIYLFSKMGSAKQSMAFSAITYLAKKGLKVFPILDIGEIGRYMRDVDYGKIPAYFKNNNIQPDDMYDATVVFVKVNMNPSFELLKIISEFMDRRTRRGNYTILLAYQPWEDFVRYDYSGYLKHSIGDGINGRIEISEWSEI